MKLLAVLLVSCAVMGASAYPAHEYGIDISEPVSQSHFECLKAANLTFMTTRCYHSYGAPDTSAPGNLKAAHAAGLPGPISVYMFPCAKCSKSGADQVKEAVSALESAGAEYDTFWFDIEGGSTYWPGQSESWTFMDSMLSEAKALKLKIGVYTSEVQWIPIFGDDYNAGAGYPLWYAHYDGQPDFDDFKPFAGWSHPAVKQFSDAGSKCGASYDINWYPTGHPPQ